MKKKKYSITTDHGLGYHTASFEKISTKEQLINRILKETKAPLCACYEYDATPTAEERLRNILKMIIDFKANL